MSIWPSGGPEPYHTWTYHHSTNRIDSVTFDVQPDTTWLAVWGTQEFAAQGGVSQTYSYRIPIADIDSITYSVNMINSGPGGGVTDIDGSTYGTTVIGNGQEWMAENLRTSRYANGDWIENIEDVSDFLDATIGAWCHYENDFGYDGIYGKLYNWYAVDDVRNVCPDGWHVPDTADYGQLLRYLETWNYQNDTWPYIESLNPPSLGTFDMYISPSGTSDVMVVNQSMWTAGMGIHVAHTANNATGLSIFESGSLRFGAWDPLPKFWSSTAVPTGSPLPVFQLGIYPYYTFGGPGVEFSPVEPAKGAAIRCIKD